MARTVTASEANQHFSRLLREASGGETITITQRGKPVARLVPTEDDESEALARQAAGIERFLAEAKTWPIRTVKWTRDDLYDDNW